MIDWCAKVRAHGPMCHVPKLGWVILGHPNFGQYFTTAVPYAFVQPAWQAAVNYAPHVLHYGKRFLDYYHTGRQVADVFRGKSGPSKYAYDDSDWWKSTRLPRRLGYRSQNYRGEGYSRRYRKRQAYQFKKFRHQQHYVNGRYWTYR